jgi:Family of unknown function (DUF6220)
MTRYLRMFYVAWLAIIAAALVVQFYLAGYGVFAFAGLPPFDAHRGLGDLIGIAILLALIAAFAARVPWRITAINAALFVLMVVQSSLAYAGIQGIAALHVVNGVLIFVVTLYLVWEARREVWPSGAPA